MTETFIVRFQEWQRYSMDIDDEVCTFMAHSTNGSWYSTVTVGSAQDMRENREAFKTYVLGALQAGLTPCEVEIGG